MSMQKLEHEAPDNISITEQLTWLQELARRAGKPGVGRNFIERFQELYNQHWASSWEVDSPHAQLANGGLCVNADADITIEWHTPQGTWRMLVQDQGPDHTRGKVFLFPTAFPEHPNHEDNSTPVDQTPVHLGSMKLQYFHSWRQLAFWMGLPQQNLWEEASAPLQEKPRIADEVAKEYGYARPTDQEINDLLKLYRTHWARGWPQGHKNHSNEQVNAAVPPFAARWLEDTTFHLEWMGLPFTYTLRVNPATKQASVIRASDGDWSLTWKFEPDRDEIVDLDLNQPADWQRLARFMQEMPNGIDVDFVRKPYAYRYSHAETAQSRTTVPGTP